jgi:hypothetical protein
MLPKPLPSKVVAQWSNYAPRRTSVQSQNWSNEQRHSRVCTAPNGRQRLDRACIGSQLSKLPDKKSSYRRRAKGEHFVQRLRALGVLDDEAAKTLVLADRTPLTVHRFDDHWISAARGDTSYELDRQNGNLTYAGSTTKGGSATITIGSGRCEIAAGPTR